MKTAEVKATYVVAESIGGVNQNPQFEGTYAECARYMSERCHNGSYGIFEADQYQPDYL